MARSIAENAQIDSERIKQFLLDPNHYPERPNNVTMRETHISRVFLTDRYVYKLKRPIQYPFLDYSTADKRLEACRNEVHLNRRLAPDVYLGVVPINESPSGHLSIGGTGSPIDWLVHMRRLNDACSLQEMIQEQRLFRLELRDITNTLIEFYNRQPPCDLRTPEYRERLESHVKGNYQALSARAELDQNLVARIHDAQLRTLRLFPNEFDNRVRDGRVVEGHGDLRPDHIYLETQPKIIDCVEFASEYRQLDVLDDLSFLAVECARLGARSIGGQIMTEYCAQTNDVPSRRLLGFYMSYRAAVRAKVLCCRLDQLKGANCDSILEQANEYLQHADRYASEMGPNLMIVVHGLSGTGKSTLSTAIESELNCAALRTDTIREDLFGKNGNDGSFGDQVYSIENRVRVYTELFRQAKERLSRHEPVVLDGTFFADSLRQKALLLARSCGARPVFFETQCPLKLSQQRVESRASGGAASSEILSDQLAQQKLEREDVTVGFASHAIDTTLGLAAAMSQVKEHLRNEIETDYLCSSPAS